MNKCRLCQQIYHNLTIINNNRLKSLTQIILKLKGFKDSWDINSNIAVCAKCIKDVENVALFWENIPEAKKESAGIAGELRQQSSIAPLRKEQHLPALTLDAEEGNDCEPSTSKEEKIEPIILCIRPPRKRGKKKLLDTKNSSLIMEPLPKRTIRCPQRYDEFQLASNKNSSALREDSSTLRTDSDACNEISFKDLPKVALIRLENNQIIGTLAEVESKGLACKIRISCQTCCQIFRFEKIFQGHLKTHYPNGSEDDLKNYLYHCKLCDKPFSNHRAVRLHFKLAHSEERHFKCFHCEASFKYKFNLNYHISTKHEPNKRFECTFCKKMFLMRYELQIHIRTHTKERPFKCELCSFAFAHKSNLKTHQRLKHFENSTQTTFLPDFENSKKSTISTRQFMPPAELIEHEEELVEEIDEDIHHSTQLQDTVIFEESALSSEKLKLTERFLDQENVFQCYSDNFEQSNTSSEQTKFLEQTVEQERISHYDFDDKKTQTD